MGNNERLEEWNKSSIAEGTINVATMEEKQRSNDREEVKAVIGTVEKVL